MTSIQRQNLDNAIAAVKRQLKLPISPLLWNYEQRIAYNKALAAYIQTNPSNYGQETLTTANKISSTDYSELENDSYLSQIGNFNDTLMNSILDSLNNIGVFAKWVIILGIIIGIAYILKLVIKLK